LVILVLFIETIFITIYTIGALFGYFNHSISPWTLVIFWSGSIIVLISTIFLRKYNKEKFSEEMSKYEESPSLANNEYFYQAPLYLFDDMHVKVHGYQKMSWVPYFNNTLQKWLSIFNFMSAAGLKLTSEKSKIILKREKLWAFKPQYTVFINDKKIGELSMLKLLKSGMKQQTPFVFKDDKNEYKFENPYFSTQTKITDIEGNSILTANRSFFDLGKNLITQRRGEKHFVTISSTENYPEQLWLALYIMVMNNKQSNK